MHVGIKDHSFEPIIVEGAAFAVFANKLQG
jgi:hypothetical protein